MLSPDLANYHRADHPEKFGGNLAARGGYLKNLSAIPGVSCGNIEKEVRRSGASSMDEEISCSLGWNASLTSAAPGKPG